MANKSKTIQYIKKEIEEKGHCYVVRGVVEEIMGELYEDDPAFETALDDFVGGIDWIDNVCVLWNFDMVLVEGPRVPPPPPDW